MAKEQLLSWKDEEGTKTARLDLNTLSLEFPVTAAAIETEMRDQCDMRKPVRAAILRKSLKKLKDLHKKSESLNQSQLDEYLFTGFIMWIDKQIGQDHLAIRDGKINVTDKAQALFESL